VNVFWENDTKLDLILTCVDSTKISNFIEILLGKNQFSRVKFD
jgi:hypothetical protein